VDTDLEDHRYISTLLSNQRPQVEKCMLVNAQPWTRTYSSQQQDLALLSVSMDNFNIDVGVMINELITSGEKGAEYSSKSSTIVM